MVARVPVKDEVGGSSPPAGAERSIVRICTMFMLLKVWFITPGMWVVPIKLKKEFLIVLNMIKIELSKQEVLQILI